MSSLKAKLGILAAGLMLSGGMQAATYEATNTTNFKPRDKELLAKVRYELAITWNERVPTARDNIGNLVINAFQLIGILLAFFIVAGLSYGGIRAFLRRGGPGGEADRMITLHLGDQ